MDSLDIFNKIRNQDEEAHIETEEGVKIPRKSDILKLAEMAKLSASKKKSTSVDNSFAEQKMETIENEVVEPEIIEETPVVEEKVFEEKPTMSDIQEKPKETPKNLLSALSSLSAINKKNSAKVEVKEEKEETIKLPKLDISENVESEDKFNYQKTHLEKLMAFEKNVEKKKTRSVEEIIADTIEENAIKLVDDYDLEDMLEPQPAHIEEIEESKVEEITEILETPVVGENNNSDEKVEEENNVIEETCETEELELSEETEKDTQVQEQDEVKEEVEVKEEKNEEQNIETQEEVETIELPAENFVVEESEDQNTNDIENVEFSAEDAPVFEETNELNESTEEIEMKDAMETVEEIADEEKNQFNALEVVDLEEQVDKEENKELEESAGSIVAGLEKLRTKKTKEIKAKEKKETKSKKGKTTKSKAKENIEKVEEVVEEKMERKEKLVFEELDENNNVVNTKEYDYFYFSEEDMENRDNEAKSKESEPVEKELGDLNLNKDILNAGNEKLQEEIDVVSTIATINGVEKMEKKEKQELIKVMYVAGECLPFMATGGLADVAGSLPKSIAKTGEVDIRVIMPLYKKCKLEWFEKFEFLGSFTVHLSWRQEYCGIFRYFDNGVVYYFVDNERYFGRDNSYGYFDDGERFAFFSKAVAECLPYINFFPDVMHCNDWQSALVPVYLKTGNWEDVRYSKIKNIYTIHNIEYQGVFGMNNLGDLFGIDERYKNDMEYNHDINLSKAAIQLSDKFTTVSESYCDNLKQPYCSRGLNHIIVRNEHKLVGILNGLDYDFYNPATDTIIKQNFDINSLDKKVENKKAFQAELGLPVDGETPLFAMVGRLVSLKGLDLVTRIIEDPLQQDIQLIIVGTGDQRFVDYFKYLEDKYPTKVRALTDKYSNELARKAYAASDIFIMPSKIEPCGISQMVASRFGSVPIVREVGGLKDSIKDFGCEEGGNGYTFANYNADDLLYLINRAIKDYKDKKGWKKKMEIVMSTDFTWAKSAQKYVDLYKSLM